MGLTSKRTLHYLPGYAPDLNPDELLRKTGWQGRTTVAEGQNPGRAGDSVANGDPSPARISAVLPPTSSRRQGRRPE
ncbi:MAG: hypothetical protein P0121_07660 [Nitrospira sp.]|nr:hypothetical protein [Nitrospira sp.]